MRSFLSFKTLGALSLAVVLQAACGYDVEVGDDLRSASTASAGMGGHPMASAGSGFTSVLGSGGAGGSDCPSGACSTPPPPTCVGAATLRTFAPSGTCDEGVCSYPSLYTECSAICSGGTCLNKAVAISVGLNYSCAILLGGALKCWGSNYAYELGDNSAADSITPVGVTGLSSGVRAVSTGSMSACALTADRAVKCWGYSGIEQMGTNPPPDGTIPADVMGLSDALAVSANTEHACAITSSGAVQCWGYNGQGQLGNNSTMTSPVPVDVTGLSSGVVGISTSDNGGCALTSTSAVKCWGGNTFVGPESDPTTVSLVPVDIPGLSSGISAVSISDNDSCALTSAGGVKCWGSNMDGQLGNNSTTESAVPVDVAGLSSGVTAISAGALSTCAITSAGGVKCWGLRPASMTNDLVPVDVVGLSSGVIAISVAGSHACALTAQGLVQCWGDNAYGELGDGTLTSSSDPVTVVGL